MASLAIILWLGLTVFGPLERLLAIAPRRFFRRRWLTDAPLGVVNQLVLDWLYMPVIAGLLLLAHGLVPTTVQAAVGGLPLLVQYVGATVIGDLMIYIVHRALHHPLLWPIHAVHHSAEEIDWMVAFRNHPIEIMLTKTAPLLPLYALGFAPVAIVAYTLTYLGFCLMIHANARLPLGPLRWLFVGPEFHHWHHAKQPAAYNKNFSGILTVWDRLFGTFNAAPTQFPKAYGVDEPMPQDAGGLLWHPFAAALSRITKKTRPPFSGAGQSGNA